MKITLSGFNGANRALHPMLLPESVGVTSLNQKPGRGDLRPWKEPATVATVPSGRKTIYRMGRDVAENQRYWLSWTGDVYAVRGFESDDTTERTYYTGDGAPKVTNNLSLDGSDPQSNPIAWRPLGLPAPTAAPVVSVASATADPNATDETRFYVYTWVNDWGWESAPSAPSSQIDCKADQHCNITGFAPAPSGNYNINRIRVYRTQTGATGSSDFYFLAEVSYQTSVVSDTGQLLGEVLPTTTWLTPPDDLSNLTALWNGMMAGVSGNSVRFCEAYTPYAWPIAYDVIPPDSKPVALGVYGQNLLVLTTGRPLLVAGSSPDSMDQQPIDLHQACIAPKSIVSFGHGVVWASMDGLMYYGSSGAKMLTAGLMTRDDWQALVPSSITGCLYEGLYFGSYDAGSGRKGFIIDPSNPQGVFFLSTGYAVAHYDSLLDQLFVLDGASIKRWDGSAAPMTYTFKSKVFHTPWQTNFSAAEVIADSYPVTFRLFADGAPKHAHSVNNRLPFRLPSGYTAQDWQLEIEGTYAVQGVTLATSIAELAQAR